MALNFYPNSRKASCFSYGDTSAKGTGKNMLGKVLMQVRDALWAEQL